MEAPATERTSVWNGLKLSVTTWKPQSTPKALLFISHGVGEHLGRYDKLGTYLAEKGVLVYGHDHVGNGRSQGDKVYVETFNTYVQDVVGHVQDMTAEYPGVPSILMGHSMGGLVATLVAEQHQSLFSALLLSGPALDTIPAYGSYYHSFLQLVTKAIKCVHPQAQLKTIDPNDISSIPEEAKAYADDPLIWHGGLKAGWIDELMMAMGQGRTNMSTITLPLFLMHGDKDVLVPFSASQFIRSNIGSQDVTFEVFADNFHEVLRDKDQERARQLIADWILAHCNK